MNDVLDFCAKAFLVFLFVSFRFVMLLLVRAMFLVTVSLILLFNVTRFA